MADDFERLKSANRGPSGKGGPEVTPKKVRELFDASRKATATETHHYWVNSAFVAGEQWVYWDEATNTVREVPRNVDRVRLSFNRLGPALDRLTAKLGRRPLVFDVRPSSADDAAVGGARIAQSVLTDCHREHKWEELRRQANWKLLKGGTAVICTEWDAEAGTNLGQLDHEDADERRGGEENGRLPRDFGTGDTIETVLGITEVATEPGTKDLETARWWIKATTLPPAEAKERYGLSEEPKADASANLSPLQRKLLAGESSGGSATPLVLVLTYFERPNKSTPKGKVGVVVGEKWVDGPNEWPFPFTDRLNCVVMRARPNDDTWTGETVITGAVQVQAAYNLAVSTITEHMKAAGNARLAVPDALGDQWDELDDDPAAIVRYTHAPGVPGPGYLSPPSMPQWWIEQPAMVRNELDDMLGDHDVSRGEAPPGVKSGIALSFLKDNDDTPVGAVAKETAEAWGRLATLVLKIFEDKVTERRTARIDRPKSPPEEVAWQGKDLAGQTTAEVPLDAVSPRSRAQQMQWALELHSRFPNEIDLKRFAALADLPVGDDLAEGFDDDVARARRENHELLAGKVPIPETFDDHAAHIGEHNRFRKTARYEQLEPEFREVMEMHVQAHETLAAEEAGRQLAKAQQSPALAGAAQADEPPLSGEVAHTVAMAKAQSDAMAQPAAAPPVAAEAPMADAAMEGTDGMPFTEGG